MLPSARRMPRSAGATGKQRHRNSSASAASPRRPASASSRTRGAIANRRHSSVIAVVYSTVERSPGAYQPIIIDLTICKYRAQAHVNLVENTALRLAAPIRSTASLNNACEYFPDRRLLKRQRLLLRPALKNHHGFGPVSGGRRLAMSITLRKLYHE